MHDKAEEYAALLHNARETIDRLTRQLNAARAAAADNRQRESDMMNHYATNWREALTKRRMLTKRELSRLYAHTTEPDTTLAAWMQDHVEALNVAIRVYDAHMADQADAIEALNQQIDDCRKQALDQTIADLMTMGEQHRALADSMAKTPETRTNLAYWLDYS